MSELKLKTSVFRRALDTVKPAIDRKITIPVLGTVKAESMDGGLALQASNIDVSIRLRVDVPYTGEAMAISAERLVTWIKLQDADDVKLKPNGTRAMLSCGRGKAQVPTIEAERFPQFAMPQASQSITVSCAELLRGLKLVAFAITDSETAHVVNAHCSRLPAMSSALSLQTDTDSASTVST